PRTRNLTSVRASRSMSGWDGPVASRSLAVRNTHALAKAGFITIRNLLEGRVEGGSAAALALAEALHNLPEPGNTFLQKLTLDRLQEFTESYPHLALMLNSAAAKPEPTA
ncbi:hypothetical protein, partial [Shigella sonnei]